MNRDLYIHTLQGMRDVFAHEHMDTQVESLDVAIWAIETQEQLQKERDAVMSDDCRRYLEMMRMERAFRIFACLCEDALGMSHELLGLRYSFKEKKFANKLLADILKVGNFGRGADYLGQNRFLVPIKSYFWVFGRCVTLGYLCPAEARWWPVSKFVRYFRGKILKKR